MQKTRLATAMALLICISSGDTIAKAEDIKATPQQAKDFLENMVAMHGTFQCQISTRVSGVDPTNRREKNLISIQGGNLILEQTVYESTHYKKGFDSKDTTIVTYVLPILEVIAEATNPKPIPNECIHKSTIYVKCKSGSECGKQSYKSQSTTDAVSVFDHKQINPSQFEKMEPSYGGGIDLNDEGIAPRAIKAFEFYQARAQAAQPSPF